MSTSDRDFYNFFLFTYTMTDISLGPRGLTIEQQKEIAIIQSQASNEPYKPKITTQTSLYVGELAPHIDEAMLKEHFGNVKSVQVCRDSVTNQSLGYAHINFYTPQDCKYIVQITKITQLSCYV